MKTTGGILSYSLNPKYFDTFSEVSCSIQGMGQWQRTGSNALAYVYILSYSAKDEETGTLFLQYKSKHTLTIEMESVADGALQTLNFIQGLYTAMNSFLRDNSFSDHSKLHLPHFEITEVKQKEMESFINQVKDLQVENAAPDTKRIFEPIEDIEPMFTTKFIKHVVSDT